MIASNTLTLEMKKLRLRREDEQAGGSMLTQRNSLERNFFLQKYLIDILL